jgi:hypothetical protein
MKVFAERPLGLLERFPMGGPAMSAHVMRLVATDTGVLDAILHLAKDASTAQRVAIGIGLAKAASACSRTHPEIEQGIKQAVADSGLSEVATAFAAGLSSLIQSMTPLATEGSTSDTSISDGPLASVGGVAPPITPGEGTANTRLDTLTFSSRPLSSTQGQTVSPTRP